MVELELKTQVPLSSQPKRFTAVQHGRQGLEVKDVHSSSLALLAHAKLFFGHCYIFSAHNGKAKFLYVEQRKNIAPWSM